MSKSVGNVADPMEAMDTFGVDGVCHYMARAGGRSRFRDDVGEFTHSIAWGCVLNGGVVRLVDVRGGETSR